MAPNVVYVEEDGLDYTKPVYGVTYEMSNWALSYLHAGHRLLALTGKRPNPAIHGDGWSWDNSIHGVPASRADNLALRDIFEHPQTTGIAILIPEHVLVADIDTDEATQLFLDLVADENGKFSQDTRVGKTAKGLHVWYLAPGEAASRWLGGRTLLFKGFGGYVAVQPSRHFDESGAEDGEYMWLTDPTGPIDWLPEGISAMLKAQDTIDAMKPKHDTDMTAFQLQFAPDGTWVSAYPTWQMDGLAHAIEHAAEGNQNNVIHWAACVARDGGVPFEAAMETLLAAAIRGRHPRNRAVSTIRGAYKRPRG